MRSILAFASVALVAALILPASRAFDFVGGFGLALFGSILGGFVGVAIVGVVGLIFVGLSQIYRALMTRESAIVATIGDLAAIGAAVIVLGVGPALAADAAAPTPATVTIPWGDWLGSLLAGVATLFIAFLTRLAAMAPVAIRAFLTNDVIAKAVDYAIATTRDAVHGQTVSIPVSNQLIAAALTWVVDNEPKIAGWADDRLRPLIVAQLAARGMIPPEASSSNLAVTSPASGA